jgi:hypothetical protein
VHVDPVGHGTPLTIQEVGAGGVLVAMHTPRQVSVCVQIAPGGHGEPPRMHCCVGSGAFGVVVRQSPLHVIVWVHVDPVGQGTPLTMQETGAGGVLVAMHAPRQVSVCVQIAPAGHGEPPRMHGCVGSGAFGVVVRQSPPHVIVWVHVDPDGQGSPPTMHEIARREKRRTLSRM